jgi:hypothetical protein
VYLLDEIGEMTKHSPEAAQAIADGVQKKLASKNPVVKFKARVGWRASGACCAWLLPGRAPTGAAAAVCVQRWAPAADCCVLPAVLQLQALHAAALLVRQVCAAAVARRVPGGRRCRTAHVQLPGCATAQGMMCAHALPAACMPATHTAARCPGATMPWHRHATSAL